MIKELIKLADYLDSRGFEAEADRLDEMIVKESRGFFDFLPFAPQIRATLSAGALFSGYRKLRNSNVKYSDKYFHCVSHCKAAKYSVMTSEQIGLLREMSDGLFKGDDPDQMIADMMANDVGRASMTANANCSGCFKYIPNGLPEKYWEIPSGMSIEEARTIVAKNNGNNMDFLRLVGASGRVRKIETEVVERERADGRQVPLGQSSKLIGPPGVSPSP